MCVGGDRVLSGGGRDRKLGAGVEQMGVVEA